MINNDLRIEPFRTRLQATGRVQIPAFLQDASAQRLRQCLEHEVPWEPAQRSDRPPLLPADAPALPPVQQDRARLMEAVRRAMSGFEFYFDRFRMIEARRDGLHPELVLHVVVDFLNSPDFLAFARELTGDAGIRMVSAMAARYRPGHFLRLHDDKSHEEDRAFAYVINLGRQWEADWGGLLQFLDDGQNVVESFTPHWNSLSLFRVPQAHQVSQVAPWAGDARYSITGWFRRT
ncbi:MULTISPECIES: 2OG-Fe(II) oxygenase family protein [unclassified Pseudoxanthomonas]|uniref:2OG-Fe(II) oxygenase n=1 Tax=unclassified Pseudoxanthomonas TaxID=2645906 RepID=UPI0008DFB12C|nr:MULTISPECIES: 2OG-Fe(II) oxygenase family protein [unclassified Pseudoxanthomonas]PPJ40878.1 hypothetical protein C0063_13310 [Pseudoxanthomonas sp. KAs_5_3]SFV31897.1 Proline 4-hydroxylase (includes Rps23 Pro-64 3,4-dihydroxylase Tpa1), contains SM-20 domain [Pseudoxanthomonas sp. YR558]